ncbi:MAG TPA: hypothetical protein VLF18_17835 [Tahibacter sp.]|uniref:hypothetical protein n=1 Tax=Tahibacter sp. TaxID=2056211 RepID=UPI002B963301|nr:hypothetical protein [Tahibacter sp.]HSX62048.1 hypothetical protein [Tahibacter sp.]
MATEWILHFKLFSFFYFCLRGAFSLPAAVFANAQGYSIQAPADSAHVMEHSVGQATFAAFFSIKDGTVATALLQGETGRQRHDLNTRRVAGADPSTKVE